MIILRRFIYTVLVSMIPAIEIKVGIPFGMVLGLRASIAYIAGLTGTTIVVVALAFLGQWFFDLCRKKGWLVRFINWTGRLAEKHAKQLNRFGTLAVFIWTAVPVPGMGTWTGSIIAVAIQMKRRWIIFSVVCGNIISGLIMVFIGGGVANLMRSNIPFFNNLLTY